MVITIIVIAAIVINIISIVITWKIAQRKVYSAQRILTGKDAERFLKRMVETNEGKHSVSKEDYLRAEKVYNEMKNKNKQTGM